MWIFISTSGRVGFTDHSEILAEAIENWLENGAGEVVDYEWWDERSLF
jgi:hypothetical protein